MALPLSFKPTDAAPSRFRLVTPMSAPPSLFAPNPAESRMASSLAALRAASFSSRCGGCYEN
jgi:hypothetical protein